MSQPQRQSDALIDWVEGQPVSRLYGDVFFSRDSGIEETRHVFLEGNRLHERFAALGDCELFTVGETGFGTGLNFLCAWRSFVCKAPVRARLHYVSVERHALSHTELSSALALWPALAPEAAALLGQWEALAPGFHRFRFEKGRVHLTLLAGDATVVLAELDAHVDAWFLDGFSPSRNPDMWAPAVFAGIGRSSRAGTTLATYTAAGNVRRGLEAVGFRVEKRRGFGRKREMLVGEFVRENPRAGSCADRARARPASRAAMVIGGGLAGTSVADALASRGFEVTLFERRGSLAAGASGNPQGILYTRLAGHDTSLRALLLVAYQHALRTLAARLPEDSIAWQRCGVLQLAFDDDEAARQASLARAGFPETLFRSATREECSAIAHAALPSAGLFFPGGGWVHPPALCRALASHQAIDVRLDTGAIGLARRDGGWVVVGLEGELARAPILVLAGGHELLELDAAKRLPMRMLSGQVTLLRANETSAALRAVLCGRSYCAPARLGEHTVGATHRMKEASEDVRVDDHAANLEALGRLAPALAATFGSLDVRRLGGRAGVRCTTPDTLPMVGALPAVSALRSEECDSPAGLFVSAAHGSRGLVTSLLAAELIAGLIDNEPLPLSASLVAALRPDRFERRGRA